MPSGNVAKNVIDNGSPDLLVTIALFSRKFSLSLSFYQVKRFDCNASRNLSIHFTNTCFQTGTPESCGYKTLPHRIGFVITN